ncbi:PDZ domain-containing protein, partial [Streptomyces sp. SID5477]|nr:PDZ domain-containing protein [Streptomyces sp. SID5477]
YLGVKISTPTTEELGALGLKADQKGALVAEVTPEGPADKAGLRFSDLVVSLNGEVIDSSTKLTRLVGAAKPGDTLRMEVLRDGRRQTITARSGTRPSETELNSENGLGQGGAAPNDPSGASATVEGLNLTPLTPALRQRLGAPASVEGLAIMGVETGVDARLGQGVVVQQVQKYARKNRGRLPKRRSFGESVWPIRSLSPDLGSGSGQRTLCADFQKIEHETARHHF